MCVLFVCACCISTANYMRCSFLRSFLYFPISLFFWDTSRANFSNADGFFFFFVLAFLHFIFKSPRERPGNFLLIFAHSFGVSLYASINRSSSSGVHFLNFFFVHVFVSPRVLSQRWRRLTIGGFRQIEPSDHLRSITLFRHQTSNLCPFVWMKFVKLNQFQVIVYSTNSLSW